MFRDLLYLRQSIAFQDRISFRTSKSYWLRARRYRRIDEFVVCEVFSMEVWGKLINTTFDNFLNFRIKVAN